jgi:hypothetical protein
MKVTIAWIDLYGQIEQGEQYPLIPSKDFSEKVGIQTIQLDSERPSYALLDPSFNLSV